MNVSKSMSESKQTASATKIRMITIRRGDKGTARAIAAVGLGPSPIIEEFKVIQQPAQRGWVSPLTRECQGSDGKRPFPSLVELTGSLKKRVEQAILETWERSTEGNAYV